MAEAPAKKDEIVLTDPKAIRAIAHPARMVVIDALYDQGGALTATQAAELAGITPSAMSYHLRALERFGIVRRAEAATEVPATSGVGAIEPARRVAKHDGRERPWVRAARDLAIRPSVASNSTAASLATGAVLAGAMDIDRERLLGTVRRATAGNPLPLDAVAGFRHTTLLVTADEASALLAKLDELIQPMRAEERTDAPPEAGHLTIAVTSVPDPNHPGGAPPDEARS